MAKSVPVLSLDSTSSLNVVAIDGVQYTLRDKEDMSYPALKRTMAAAKRMEVLGQKEDDLTAADEAEIGQILTQVCVAVLDAPLAVIERLSDVKKSQIATVFTSLSAAAATATRAKATRPTKKTAKRRRG